jgi:hypothetical protein
LFLHYTIYKKNFWDESVLRTEIKKGKRYPTTYSFFQFIGTVSSKRLSREINIFGGDSKIRTFYCMFIDDFNFFVELLLRSSRATFIPYISLTY